MCTPVRHFSTSACPPSSQPHLIDVGCAHLLDGLFHAAAQVAPVVSGVDQLQDRAAGRNRGGAGARAQPTTYMMISA